MNYNYLVLSGGAAKGLAYIGVLQYFEEEGNILKDIKEYIGCSIGAFSALLIILGYKSVALKNIFNNYNLDLLKSFKVTDFFDKYGLDQGKKIEAFIKIFIKSKEYDEDITLKEFYKKTNKKLITVVTNVNTKQTEYISVDNHPDMPVYLAVQMSMSIPFIYHPIKYDDKLYVDGGLTCNCPVRYYFDKERQELEEFDYNKILCLFLREKRKNEDINNFDDYLYNILKSSFSTIENIDILFAKSKNCNIVTIEVDMTTNFNLDITNEKKEILYKYGYDNIKEFFINKKKEMS